MRICRGDQVIGERSGFQIKKGIADASLLLTDSYYHEDSAEWLPLSDLLARLDAPKPVRPPGRTCYCGGGLPFSLCHGSSSHHERI